MGAHGIGNIKPFHATRCLRQPQEALQVFGFLVFHRGFTQMLPKGRGGIFFG